VVLAFCRRRLVAIIHFNLCRPKPLSFVKVGLALKIHQLSCCSSITYIALRKPTSPGSYYIPVLFTKQYSDTLSGISRRSSRAPLQLKPRPPNPQNPLSTKREAGHKRLFSFFFAI